jgi:hypothetical protein
MNGRFLVSLIFWFLAVLLLVRHAQLILTALTGLLVALLVAAAIGYAWFRHWLKKTQQRLATLATEAEPQTAGVRTRPTGSGEGPIIHIEAETVER